LSIFKTFEPQVRVFGKTALDLYDKSSLDYLSRGFFS